MSTQANLNNLSQLYSFKNIQKIVDSNDLIDIVLSKTQRQTPTVVHPQYDIRRIRSFYMRKVKHCQQCFHDKLQIILDQFPRIDDIHPFYADFCSVLYNRDHYKIALGQVKSVLNNIDGISKEYIKLLKYSDSPFKCKMLKRAALGRMCTMVKKLKNVLVYLEEIRQNLSRMPAINPFAKTLILAGHPNVGKSTFMNVLSNANVETADWSFTTRSLYAGHFDYKYEKWQVIDTPGILDRPLNTRNTIEMCSITAIAHLQSSILFLVDISVACGYSITEQVSLCLSLEPLLKTKPLIIVLNKVDARSPDDLSDEEKDALNSLLKTFENCQFVACSTLNNINLDEAKNIACDALIQFKNKNKLLTGQKVDTNNFYMSKVVLNPNKPFFNIPGSLTNKENLPNILEKDKMELYGGPGVYQSNDKERWLLKNSDWVDDVIPEFYNGKNISDFIDVDIETKLKHLEKEEAKMLELWNPELDGPSSEWYEANENLRNVTIESKRFRERAGMKKSKNSLPPARKTLDMTDFAKHVAEKNEDVHHTLNKLKSIKLDDVIDEDNVDRLLPDEDEEINIEGISIETCQKNDKKSSKTMKVLSKRLKALSLTRLKGNAGLLAKKKIFKFDKLQKSCGNDQELKDKIYKKFIKTQKNYVKPTKKQTKDQINESDRFIGTKRPKHLYSGKRGIGKTDRR